MSLDLAQHVEWSQDDDYYYATVELRTPDNQIGTVEVRIDRPWVIRTAQAVRQRLLATAPAGVDVGAWRNPSDPARFQKLCRYVAGAEVKRQLAEQVQRDGIVIAPWFGEWTTATADAAYKLICAARAGDEVSIQQLDRIRECAEAGDPAAAHALGMINSVAKLVARNLPPPSVVAARLPSIGAVPRRRAVPARRPAPPRRQQPPARRKAPARRSGGVAPRSTGGYSGSGSGSGATAAAAPRLSPAFAASLAAALPLARAPAPAPARAAFTPRALLAPGVAALVPRAPAPPPSPYGVQPPYPYGMAPPTDPYGGGGGGYGGDLGPDDFLAPEEENGAGDMLDEDDGTYYEEPQPADGEFPEEQDRYAVGEFPEEIAQSESDEDDAGVPDENGALPGEDGGPFPGEGSVGSA